MNSRSNRIRLALALVAILACLLAQGGWATTYYVSTTGLDTNDGLAPVVGEGHGPWKTINKGDVSLVLNAGDTVLVAAGIYNTTASIVMMNRAGTAVAPITYLAQGKVTINCTSNTAYAVQIKTSGALHADYNIFDGFEVKGGRYSLLVNGNSNLATGLIVGVKVRNCIFRDTVASATTSQYLVSTNTTRELEFTRNIIAITNYPTSSTWRAITCSNTGLKNKFYNNTIYVNGPRPTLSPFALNGGVIINQLNTAATEMANYVMTWSLSIPGHTLDDQWIAAKVTYDGSGNIIEDQRNQFINNIVWVKHVAGVGVYDETPPLDPLTMWYHTTGLKHSHNAFCPAQVGGWGGLMYAADFRANNCPFPEDSFAHTHVWQPGGQFAPYPGETVCSEFETNSLAFVSTDPTSADFFKLPTGSACIDAGVDVGLPYLGLAPDLGAIEYIPPAFSSSIADALAQPHGSVVTLTSVVVTVGSGVLNGNVIYVEDESRASGVAVQSSPSLLAVAEGERVEITGQVLKTGLPQPIISALSIRFLSGGTPLKPLGTPNKSAVGLTGLDNTGLLVTIWGKVNAVSSDYFCVDDGSGRDDATGTDGIPVFISDQVTPLTTPTATYVAVTGVLGKIDVGGGAWVAVIRPRVQADIKSYAP